MYVLHYQNIFKQSHVKKTHKYPQGDFVWFSTKFSEVQSQEVYGREVYDLIFGSVQEDHYLAKKTIQLRRLGTDKQKAKKMIKMKLKLKVLNGNTGTS